MKGIVWCLVLLLLLSSCAPLMRGRSSYSGPLPETTARSIADDAAARMAVLYPPGHTTLALVRPAVLDPKKAQEKAKKASADLFAGLFENALRGRGFKIAALGASGAGLQVSWVVDALPSDLPGQPHPASAEDMVVANWYLRLDIVGNGELRSNSRVYEAQGQAQAGWADGQME